MQSGERKATNKPVLEVKELQAHFYTRRGVVKAVDGISFKVGKGETLGIVGESGSGKSVSQLSYLHLLPSPPLQIVGGEVIFDGIDLLTANEATLRSVRGNRISMIFQEPMTSLNPYLKIGTQLIEPLVYHRDVKKKEAWKRGIEALERVGIPEAESAMKVYPHEFSGGMCQRVMIAMALTTKPEVLIADEPTTALDVTVQAQILELLKNIQKDTGMAIILITHDLGVIATMADRVLVMYAGNIFERGEIDDIFYHSQHPYTYSLLKSTPRLDTKKGVLPSIPGTPPDLSRLRAGCPFYERCDFRMDVCHDEFPQAKTISPKHLSYCHSEELAK